MPKEVMNDPKRLVPPGGMIQGSYDKDFAALSGQVWDLAVRELTDPQDCYAMAGELARFMAPDLGDFLNFGLDLAKAPTPGPRVQTIMAQLLNDHPSAPWVIGAAANWCQNQYVSANLHSVVWADRVLSCGPGEGAAFAAAERELVLAIARFNGNMQRVYGETGVGLLAAVIGRVLGNVPEVASEFLASMERSRQIDQQLARETA